MIIRSILFQCQYILPDASVNGRHLRRIVSEVKEERNTFQTSILFEIAGEETSCFQIDTHGTENNREIVLMTIVRALICYALLLNQSSLTTNLGSDFVVRKTGGRENGNFLATSDGVHGIDGGDAGGDHLLGVDLATL